MTTALDSASGVSEVVARGLAPSPYPLRVRRPFSVRPGGPLGPSGPRRRKLKPPVSSTTTLSTLGDSCGPAPNIFAKSRGCRSLISGASFGPLDRPCSRVDDSATLGDSLRMHPFLLKTSLRNRGDFGLSSRGRFLALQTARAVQDDSATPSTLGDSLRMHPFLLKTSLLNRGDFGLSSRGRLLAL
jgi:hypothetical protein